MDINGVVGDIMVLWALFHS